MRTYGSIELTVSSPPQSFTEPITLEEAKTFLGLPIRFPEELAEDAMIEGFITGAREVAEIFQNRILVEKQFDLYLDYFPCDLELPTPLTSVDMVRYRDSDGNYTALADLTDYVMDAPRGLLMPLYGTSWPRFTGWPSGAVLVRFTAGYSASDPFWLDAGKRLKIGMQMLISAWFNGRLPFEPANLEIQEYPFTVTSLLSFGAVPRVR